MLEAVVCELTPVVALFVQPHHSRHVELPEDVCVVLWRPSIHTVVDFLPSGGGAAESDVFAGNNDVQIAVFDALVVLVQLDVKRCEINEVEVFSPLKTGHAVGQSQSVRADTVTGVSVRQRGRGCGLERLERVLGSEALATKR